MDVVEQIPINKITFLWYDDFYDGYLSGILEYENKKCRFEILTNWKLGIRPRKFAIINLTMEQLNQETYWHHLFEQHVGTNSVSPSNNAILYQPLSEHHKFYSEFQKRNKADYKLTEVIGWFIET